MIRRIAVGVGVLTLAIVASAAPAWAHVTVAPVSADKGASDVEIAFRVPNEEGSASTTKVQIAFPTSPPMPGVLAQAVPGWTAKVATQHLANPIHTDDGDVSDVVSQVTWTASAGSAIEPSGFQRFEILVGQLPEDVDQIVFKAVQTYSNGDVVRWIDPVTPGGPEAEHPTPILELTNPGGSTPTTAASSGSAAVASTSTKDSSARAIGILALVVGALALLAATATMMRKRRIT